MKKTIHQKVATLDWVNLVYPGLPEQAAEITAKRIDAAFARKRDRLLAFGLRDK